MRIADRRRALGCVSAVMVLLLIGILAAVRYQRAETGEAISSSRSTATGGTAAPAPAAASVADATPQACDGSGGPAEPVRQGVVRRVVAGAEPVTDSQDATWSPSEGWIGGRVVSRSRPVTKTGSPDLFRDARVAVEGLRVDLPAPGTYAVNVSAADDPGTAPGARVFDVVANGVEVATGQDVVASVGTDVPYHLLFSVPVTDRCLDMRFVPVAGDTNVANVEIGYLGPDLSGAVTWRDEFDGPSGTPVDPRKWQHETGASGWGNRELQAYTDEPASSSLDGQGHLRIVARHTGGPAGSPSARYQSARIITKDRATFRYGRIEVRARPPEGAGLWPAFWALGDDIDEVGFPRSGEIDIMEAPGGAGRLLGNLHGANGQGDGGDTFSLGRGIDDAFTGMATFDALWTPVGISLRVDGRAYFTASASDLPSGTAWPFDKPYYLLLNLAVGGSLPGPPTASTPFPAAFVIDHVRVTTW